MLGRKKSKTIRAIQEIIENMDLLLEAQKKYMLMEATDKKNTSDPLDKFDVSKKKLDILLFDSLLKKINTYLRKHPHRVVNNDFCRDQIKDIVQIIYKFLQVENVSLLSVLAVKNLWPSADVEKEKKYFPIFSEYQVSLTYERDNIEKAMQEIEAVLARVNDKSNKPDTTLRKLFANIFNEKKNKKVIENVYRRYEEAVSVNAPLIAASERDREYNKNTYLLSIPPELIMMIMFYLEAQDKINMGLTSSALHDISVDESLWKQEVKRNNMIKYECDPTPFKSFFFKNIPCSFMVINDCSLQRSKEYNALSFLNNDFTRVVVQIQKAGRMCKLFSSLRAAQAFAAELRESNNIFDDAPIYILEFALTMDEVRGGLKFHEDTYHKLIAVHPEKNGEHDIVKVHATHAFKYGYQWQVHYTEKKLEESASVERVKARLT